MIPLIQYDEEHNEPPNIGDAGIAQGWTLHRKIAMRAEHFRAYLTFMSICCPRLEYRLKVSKYPTSQPFVFDGTRVIRPEDVYREF